jgi:hypothetical protein
MSMNDCNRGLWLRCTLATACAADTTRELPVLSASEASHRDTDLARGRDRRLDAAARKELLDVGTLKYRNKAVPTGETQQEAGVRVTFDPASGPICLRGGEYAAFYQDKGSDKTMIVLDGGGACWTGLCQAEPAADATMLQRFPITDDAANPFRDWNVVFAPYCDGSVFAGDNQLNEADGTPRYHHGRQNLAAALDLAEQHFGDAKQVLLAGWSAGGFGTIWALPQVRLRYPAADLSVMDDAGPGAFDLDNTAAIETRLQDWHFADPIPPSCTACAEGRGQFTELLSWMLQHDRSLRVSVLSYFEDAVIGTAFNKLDGAAYKALLLDVTGPVQAAYPDRFARYMLPGATHVLSNAWSTISADGVGLPDWIGGMVERDPSRWRDVLATGP